MNKKDNSGINDSDKIIESVRDGLKSIFPIETNTKKLDIEDIEFKESKYNPDKWKDIKEAILRGQTIGVPYSIKFKLTDKVTGDVIDRSKLNIGTIPIENKLNSFLVKGNSYNIPLQLRLKPSASSRINNKGEAEVFSNVENGQSFRTTISPQQGKINLSIKQGNIPIIPVLKLLGVGDKDIIKNIGSELYKKNIDVKYDTSIKKLYLTLFRKHPESITEAEESLREYFSNTKTTPEINQKTLGSPYNNINGAYILDTAKKVIAITKGTEKPDNREQLLFKNVYGVEDLLKDQLSRAKKTGAFYKMKYRMNKDNKISSIIDKKSFNKYIEDFFTSSKISRYADQTNPISILSNRYQTTPLGEGGIGESSAVTDAAKYLQNSHMGFLDPVHTPESHSAGVSLLLAENTRKEGNQLKTEVIDLLKDKKIWISIKDLEDEILVFPGEFIKKDGKWVPMDNKVGGIYNDDIKYTNPSMVRYMLASNRGMFDVASNTMPFMNSNQGNRALTGAKMALQSIVLENPEKPLVEVYDHERNSPILDEIGDYFTVRSDVSGKVKTIDKDTITIESNGKEYQHDIPFDIPLNDKSFLDSKVKVKVGDFVKKGDLLADTEFTDNGKNITGVNLNIAYMPWKGLNHEDAVVISENAANKLRSTHIYKKNIPLDTDVITDMNKYKHYSPYSFDRININNYDESGVIKPGSKVKKGDILVASLKKKTVGPADTLIERLKKSAVGPFQDNSLSWDKDFEGRVTDVVKDKNKINVYIKTTEPVKEADKIAGRHGNKATISAIIPDNITPVTKDGKKIDLIFDSHTVHPRINLGQLLETGAGKIAEKTGKPFRVDNFSGEDYRKKILKTMEELGITEKEDIFDPATGKNIPAVFTGPQYINKLKHQVETKSSARGTKEPYTYDNQPIAGGGHGGMSIDTLTNNALLSHNAKAFIRDAFSIKNNPNSEYWHAIQNMEIPPTPDVPYEWNKFKSLLKGMGINTVSKGTSLKLTPLMDKDIAELSAGEIKNPTRSFIGKGDRIKVDKDGLFGDISGGMRGDKFNHIKLNTVIPNPAYKDSIKSLLHITEKEFNKLIEEAKDDAT
jgi:DNA-directed RNA polymerase subunit beta